jgi:tetrathionate reductase subunit A
MDAKKRRFLGTGAALLGAGALAAASAGAGKKVLDGLLRGTAGEPVRDPVNKNSLEPEYAVDAQGRVSPGKGARTAFDLCWGCTTLCGVRLHIDAATEQVARVAGNPYNPLSSSHALPMEAPVSAALRSVSARADAPESPWPGTAAGPRSAGAARP